MTTRLTQLYSTLKKIGWTIDSSSQFYRCARFAHNVPTNTREDASYKQT